MTTTSENGHPHRWLLHIMVLLYYSMGFMARFAWSPVIPKASPDLGINMADAGAYMSAFYIGYVLIQIPGGILCDRLGARVVLACCLLIEALGTVGLSLAPDFSMGFACRVLTGVGAGTVYAACVRYVAILFPTRETGLAFGLLMAAPVGVGVILPNAIMPWLQGFLSWRGAFQAISVVIAVFAAVALLLVRDAGRAKGEVRREGANFGAVVRNKNILILSFSTLFMLWLLVSFTTWSNTYLESLKYTAAQAGRVMLFYGVGGLIGSPLGGAFIQRVRSPKLFFIVLLAALGGLTLLFGELASSLVLLSSLALIFGLVMGAAQPITPFLLARLASKENLATAGGLNGAIIQVGAMLGPWVVGKSIDLSQGFAWVWFIMAAGPVVAILLLLPLRLKDEPHAK